MKIFKIPKNPMYNYLRYSNIVIERVKFSSNLNFLRLSTNVEEKIRVYIEYKHKANYEN